MAGLKNLKKKRRVQLIVGLGSVLVVGFLLIWFFIPRDAFQYFRSPTEVVEAPPVAAEVFRLGGLVKSGSLVKLEGTHFEFVMTDTNMDVRVVYIGDNPAPDLFSEGQGAIATGSMNNETFEATEILAKHDESYMPKEVIDALKEQGVYVEPKTE